MSINIREIREALTIREAAGRLGVPEGTVRMAINKGILRPLLGAEETLIPVSEVEAYPTRSSEDLKERFFRAPIQNKEEVLTLSQAQALLGLRTKQAVLTAARAGKLQGPPLPEGRVYGQKYYKESVERYRIWRELGIEHLRRLDARGELPEIVQDTVTYKDAAALAGVTDRTVYNLVRAGKIRVIQESPVVLLSRADVEEYARRKAAPEEVRVEPPIPKEEEKRYVMLVSFTINKPSETGKQALSESLSNLFGEREKVEVSILSVTDFDARSRPRAVATVSSAVPLRVPRVLRLLKRDAADLISDPRVEWETK